MKAKVDDDSLSYSIGRRSYGKFRVANCEFYLLDTRGDRDMHDVRNRSKPGVSMLGKPQRGGYCVRWNRVMPIFLRHFIRPLYDSSQRCRWF